MIAHTRTSLRWCLKTTSVRECLSRLTGLGNPAPPYRPPPDHTHAPTHRGHLGRVVDMDDLAETSQERRERLAPSLQAERARAINVRRAGTDNPF